MAALVGFLRRQGYLPGTENGYQPDSISAVTFYRIGGMEERLILTRDTSPWTLEAQSADENGNWISHGEAMPVRDFVVELQTAANDGVMAGEVGGAEDKVWPVFGAALNDALRQSHGWVARLDNTSNDNGNQTILIGSEATGVQRRLTFAINGPDRGAATLEMLSHGEPSEWLPLDEGRLTSMLRTKDAALAIARFLRLA
ncbi:MAG: hypothetical protein KI792_09235 [Alphaproteobacteria bacterium]|nr:hypothetical protein [Alphaproteobacteria bacterium SS10]